MLSVGGEWVCHCERAIEREEECVCARARVLTKAGGGEQEQCNKVYVHKRLKISRN